MQTQHFVQDRLEQYNDKESVRIYGIPESAEGDATREDTNEVVLKVAPKIGANITSQDVSVSHRIGRRGRGNKHHITKFVRRDCKSDIIRCKKEDAADERISRCIISTMISLPSVVGSSTS